MSNNLQKKSNKNSGEYITLDKAELNVPYVIISCDLDKRLQERFAELGFVEDAEIRVIKSAPLHDPLEIKVMGYSLCARAKELKHFTVARLNDD